MSHLSQLTLLVTSPTAFFAELKQKPNFWFPLLLIVVASALVAFWYVQVVDFEWAKDREISTALSALSGFHLPEAQRAQIIERMSKSVTHGSMMRSAIFGSAFAIPFMLAFSALYLFLVGKATKVKYSFKSWFAMASWTSLPTLIGVVAAALTLVTQAAPIQLSQYDLQVLSLNELFFHRTAEQPGYLLLVSLTIPLLLQLGLAVVGVKVWSERSWLFSAIYALSLSVLVFGVWALIAFR